MCDNIVDGQTVSHYCAEPVLSSHYLFSCWLILHAFFCQLWIFFFKINFFKQIFQEYH